MPEFPEVNVQVRYLRERCTGWSVSSFETRRWNPFKNLDDPSDAESTLWGATIQDITQRGKHVLIHTDRGIVQSHLMFRGRWSVEGDPFISPYKYHKDAPQSGHRTFMITNDQGATLGFYTPEFKAHLNLYAGTQDASAIDKLSKLGPEVVVLPETDPAFAKSAWTLDNLRDKAARSRQAIKAFLLDQKRQSGLGNMYVCEALYDAKINPTRPAKELSEDELAALHRACQDNLRRAVESELNYDRILRVYRRDRDPQGNRVETVKINRRDTFWVPAMQH